MAEQGLSQWDFLSHEGLIAEAKRMDASLTDLERQIGEVQAELIRLRGYLDRVADS